MDLKAITRVLFLPLLSLEIWPQTMLPCWFWHTEFSSVFRSPFFDSISDHRSSILILFSITMITSACISCITKREEGCLRRKIKEETWQSRYHRANSCLINLTNSGKKISGDVGEWLNWYLAFHKLFPKSYTYIAITKWRFPHHTYNYTRIWQKGQKKIGSFL